MNKTALLFNNFGIQSVDVNKKLYNEFYSAKQIFDDAENVCGIRNICLSDNHNSAGNDLASIAQGLAISSVIKANNIKVDCVAGYEVGEYAALAYSGIITPSEALTVAAERNNIVKKTATANFVWYEVDGLDNATIFSACNEFDGAFVLSYNNMTNSVCYCDKKSENAFLSRIKSLNGKYKQIYEITSILQPDGAKDEFKSKLTNIHVRVPKIKVYANRTGKPYQINRDAIISNITNQFCSSIRWANIIDAMTSGGVDTFILVGNNNIGKYVSGAKVIVVNDVASLKSAINSLSSEQTLSNADGRILTPNVRIA